MLVLLKAFDLASGLAFGEASPGAFGAVACPAWLDGVDPFIFGPFALDLCADALDTCYMHAVLPELSIGFNIVLSATFERHADIHWRAFAEF